MSVCDYSTCSTIDELSALLDRLQPNADAGVQLSSGADVSRPGYRDGYLSALADVAVAFGLANYGPAAPSPAPAARLADVLREASLRLDFTSARVLELADGSRRWAVLAEYVHGNGERVERLTLEHDGRVTREQLS